MCLEFRVSLSMLYVVVDHDDYDQSDDDSHDSGRYEKKSLQAFFDIEHSTLNLLKPYLRPYLRLVASCRP